MTMWALGRVRLSGYDAVGAALVTAFSAWIVVSAVVRAGNPLPQLAVASAGTAAYVTGRRFGRSPRGVVRAAAAVVVAIVLGVVLSGPAVLSGGPLAPPLGYGNANGSLYVLGAGAAVIVALCARPESVRATAGLFAGVFAVLATASLSRAAAILAATLLLVALVSRHLPRWTILVAPLVVALTVSVTIVLGLTRGRAVVPRLIEELSERRPQLWAEAMEIAAANPVFGVGPGMFAHTSPTAMSDADARWAHSAYLQVSAELGVVGAILIGLLVLWTYGALYRSGQRGRPVLVGSAIVTAFAVHAGIDFVAHFPVVLLIAALLAGACSFRPRPLEHEAAAVSEEDGDS